MQIIFDVIFVGRSFNKNAAERHIEFCKEQSARKAILNKQNVSGRRNTESTKTRPRTRSSITSSSGNSSVFSHNEFANKVTITNGKSSTNRRPSNASAMIHGVESVERKVSSSNTRLPQPTKRSNSAPRGKEISPQLGKSNSISGKSTFATPKSAGNYAIDNRLAKKLTKQHI
ncbi:hypothetical protein Mgra_00008290 [Meloidogyne graminicola]|uniref:Uncharacterized protein n=1 Tax=Meloidogyne graminicola TaxID=189291 RepID=A0A8S9ZG89_9BILA|nr:hypothetical protein Mgra_00008290 [Meloidogyne graminicola]